MSDLESGHIHLFQSNLDCPPLPAQRLEAVLSADEVARADRFRFEHLRRRYVAATGLLRFVLSRVVGTSPDALHLEKTARGKPYLPGGPSFNLSHSDCRLLIGLASEGHLGVDIEVHRPISRMEHLAKRTFSGREASAILAVSSDHRTAAFFRVWTRKEALAKAVGLGLAMPLDAFSVSAEVPGTPEPTNAFLGADDPDRFTLSLREALGGAAPRAAEWWIAPLHLESALPTHRALEAPAQAAVAWDRAVPPVIRTISLD